MISPVGLKEIFTTNLEVTLLKNSLISRFGQNCACKEHLVLLVKINS